MTMYDDRDRSLAVEAIQENRKVEQCRGEQGKKWEAQSI